MEARGLWISYSYLAQALEQQDLREALLAEFALTHLYALASCSWARSSRMKAS